MTNKNYELEVLINGKPVKEYVKDGKIYVEGRRGTDFSLRIRNNSSKRILAIPSVDGLSVMNGKTASYNSSGYIINAWDSVTIDGWRTSDKEVARFYFSRQEDSYAAKMDRDGNTGVIGMAVFTEKYNELELLQKAMEKWPTVVEKHIHHHDYHGCWSRYCYLCMRYHCTCQPCYPYTWTLSSGTSVSSSSYGLSAMNAASDTVTNVFNVNATPTASASMQVNSLQQELGTGWGESKKSEVRSVEFERADSPEAVFEIFYNTREQLELLGVDFNTKPVYVAPQAFPGVYCEPPKK